MSSRAAAAAATIAQEAVRQAAAHGEGDPLAAQLAGMAERLDRRAPRSIFARPDSTLFQPQRVAEPAPEPEYQWPTNCVCCGEPDPKACACSIGFCLVSAACLNCCDCYHCQFRRARP